MLDHVSVNKLRLRMTSASLMFRKVWQKSTFCCLWEQLQPQLCRLEHFRNIKSIFNHLGAVSGGGNLLETLCVSHVDAPKHINNLICWMTPWTYLFPLISLVGFDFTVVFLWNHKCFTRRNRRPWRCCGCGRCSRLQFIVLLYSLVDV